MNIREEAEIVAPSHYGQPLNRLSYHEREALFRRIRVSHNNSTVAPSKPISEAMAMSHKLLSKYFSSFYIIQRTSEVDDEIVRQRHPGGIIMTPDIPVYIVKNVGKEYAELIKWYKPTKRIHKEDIVTYLTIKSGMQEYGPQFLLKVSQEDIEMYTKVGLDMHLKNSPTSSPKDLLFNDKKYPYTLKNISKLLKCVYREYWFLLFPLTPKKFFGFYRIPLVFDKGMTLSLRLGLRQSHGMTWHSDFPVRDWSYLASVLYDFYYLILIGESYRKFDEYLIQYHNMGVEYVDKKLSEVKSDIGDNISLLGVSNLSPMDTAEIFKNRRVYRGITSVRETAKIWDVPKDTLLRRFREIETCRIADAQKGEEKRKKMGLEGVDKLIEYIYKDIEYDEWIKIMEEGESILWGRE